MTSNRRSFLQTAAVMGAVSPLAVWSQTAAKLTLQAAWVNDAEFMGYFIAMDNGYYKAEGLELNYLSGGPDVIPEASLLSKKADVALTTVETAIKAITDQKAPLVIIGAQYQKNPVGIVSLASKPLKTPADLVGKTIAVPPVNRLTVEALLKLNGIDKSKVKIVPYAYDPTPLIKGEIDGSLDFTTNVPFTIKSKGQDATSFLLADFKLPLFNDVIVVTKDTLKNRRKDLLAFLRASKKGWVENFKDTAAYPPKFKDTWFKGTGRSVENELFFNQAQKSLIEHPALNAVNVKASKAHFDTSLLKEI
ncbi:MAG: ABC transporter substrate-binding protein [Burkholderiales bacterium]|nr:ABC transporter substrate-binding protein [Burkholderiales bacterium]